MDYAKRITRLRELRRLRREAAGLTLPRNCVVRQRSLGEAQQRYRPWGRGLFVCVHDKPYIIPCTACKRGAAEALAALAKLAVASFQDVT